MDRGSLTGLLLDVSGSMKENAVGSTEDEGEWVRSLFQVIDDVITHDVQASNRVFTIGFGGQSNDGTFDILKSIDKAQKLKEQLEINKQKASRNIVNDIFSVLEHSGATYIRNWTQVDTAQNFLSQAEADLLLEELQKDHELARRVVHECLPSVCRGISQATPIGGLFGASPILDLLATTVASTFRQATPQEVQSAVASGMALIKSTVLIPVNVNNAIKSVHEAAKTIRGTVKKDVLSDERINELLDLVKPYIYDGTPIESALFSASQIFQKERSVVEKVMIVISDGEWSNALSFAGKFEDVTIVCCFVSRSSNIRPRHLFDTVEESWNVGAKNLFKLSSVVPSQMLPRSMIIQNGWSFDIEKNQTKLFAHVNNPEHMREICRLGKNIACNQECLSDLLVTLSFDIYINQSNTGFSARQQVEATCYANASATAIHLSLKRILGREGGYPDFDRLRDELIREHGSNGAVTFDVLRTVCPRYRLRCSEINFHDVFKAIVAKRIVVAKFRLTGREWDAFDQFYRLQPGGILSKQYLDIRQRSSGERPTGHAVVVTSYTSNCLILMNSWGENWADKGFFRVESADVLGLEFMDVYWTENDLTTSERKYYKEHGPEVAKTLISKLRGLQVQTYTCPLCSNTSPVNRFTGTLSNAKCPHCHRLFKCSEAGNILAMNIYLTSIAPPPTA